MAFTKLITSNNRTFGGKIDLKQNSYKEDLIVFDKVINSEVKFKVENDKAETLGTQTSLGDNTDCSDFSSITMLDGRIFTSYSNGVDSGKGYYVIYDPNTNTLGTQTSLGDNTYCSDFSSITMLDGRIFTSYHNAIASTKGYYVIYSPESQNFVECKNNIYTGIENGQIIDGVGDLP